VDLLDRVLDKGLMLDADLIIHVAGIPLLGVKLRAALAGMETMLKYGIWEDWDEAQRAIATEEYRQKERPPEGTPPTPQVREPWTHRFVAAGDWLSQHRSV